VEIDHVRLMQERINLNLLKLLFWIFCLNYGYMMLDDYFGSKYEDFDVPLTEFKVFMIMRDLSDFLS